MKVAQTSLFVPSALNNGGGLGNFFVWPAILLGVVIFVAQRRFKNVHPVIFILFAGIVGAVFGFGA
ncbi:membrane protein [gut metagenome]|uniref:Membrane protein n=1 Tax=gut metagenome TaxID=749906 RepID=J9G2I1_9ZZZZ